MVFGASGHFSKIFTMGTLRKLENLRLFQSLMVKSVREERPPDLEVEIQES